MESNQKACCCADIYMCQDNDGKGLVITAALPGVHQEDLKLHMTADSLCLAGERDDLKYDCCYELPWVVNEEMSDAHFDNGLLTIKVPFKEADRGKLISIH